MGWNRVHGGMLGCGVARVSDQRYDASPWVRVAVMAGLYGLLWLGVTSYQMVLVLMNDVAVHMGWRDIGAALGHRAALWEGLSFAVFTITGVVMAPVIGSWSDRVGRRPVVLICLAMIGVGATLGWCAMQLRSAVLFVISCACMGIALNARVVVQATLSDWFEHRARVTALSWTGVALTLGVIVGPWWGTQAAAWPEVGSLHALGWPWLGLAVTAGGVWWVLWYGMPAGRMASGLSAPRCDTSQVHNARLWCLFAMECGWALGCHIIPLWWSEDGTYTTSHIAHGLSLCGWSLIAGLVLFPSCAQRWGMQRMLGWSLWWMIMCWIMVMCKPWLPAWSWWAFVGLGGAVGCAYTSLLALYVERVHPAARGASVGWLMAWVALAWTLAGSLTRWAWWWMGSWVACGVILSWLCALGCARAIQSNMIMILSSNGRQRRC